MKYAVFDESGFPLGFYAEDIHGARMRPTFGPAPEPSEEDPYPVPPVVGEEPNPACLIPAGAVAITDEQWSDFVDNQGRRKWIGGQVVVFDPPAPPAPVPTSISDRQFFQQLAIDDVISEAEAEAAVATGTIPAEMLALIDDLPEAQRFGARMMLKGATVFERHHPLTVTIGQLYGWEDEQIDDLFQDAAAL